MRSWAWFALGGLVATGCLAPTSSGEWGSVRYFSNVLGQAPLRLVPPLSDREGNTYVLYGAPDWFNTLGLRVSVTGDRPTTCDPDPADTDPGTYGLHGWVGRTTDRVWYWTGTALVELQNSGSCEFVLRSDPVSGTEVKFLGIAPFVDDTPSRRFAYALVEGGTGEVSFTLIDLDRALPFNTRRFPEDDPAGDLRVVATGGWEAERTPVFVVAFSGRVQAFYLDRFGEITARRDVALSPDIAAYAVPGFLQFDDAGNGVGLLDDGSLFMLSPTDSVLATPNFDAQGLLAWEGALYVTGEQQGTAVLARVNGPGVLSNTVAFRSANLALQGLAGGLDVDDERSRPIRPDRWDDVRSAIGGRPLISPWPLDPYTTGSVGWILAGPSFSTGLEPVTAIGFAPVGLEVP